MPGQCLLLCSPTAHAESDATMEPLACWPGRLAAEGRVRRPAATHIDLRLRDTGGKRTAPYGGDSPAFILWLAARDDWFTDFMGTSRTAIAAVAATLLATLPAFLAGCSGRAGRGADIFTDTIYAPAYASGFVILGCDTMASTVLRVTDPWQGAQGVVMDCFVRRDGELPPEGFDGQVVEAGCGRVVCMSSSYVAMLDCIGEVRRVAAVSGLDFVSNPYVEAHRQDIADVGAEPSVEILAALRPGVVMLYGVNSAQTALTDKLEEAGIPYIYMGEYIENSPLGKAEWVVAVSELLDCRDKGTAAFAPLPARYDSVKALVAGLGERPKVMVNAPWGDTWYMPSTASYVVRLIEDAGGEYVYKANATNASSTIGMETALALLAQSDVWLDAGNVGSLGGLVTVNPAYASVPPVTGKRVWNPDRRTNGRGANDFWESAVVMPDVVLRDLVEIMHPGATGSEPYFYRRLE